jgi:hypothetical protein
MNPERLAKIRALATDPRGDPATRAIAQKKLDAWLKWHPQSGVVPGMRQSPEYQAWAKSMKEANRGRRKS